MAKYNARYGTIEQVISGEGKELGNSFGRDKFKQDRDGIFVLKGAGIFQSEDQKYEDGLMGAIQAELFDADSQAIFQTECGKQDRVHPELVGIIYIQSAGITDEIVRMCMPGDVSRRVSIIKIDNIPNYAEKKIVQKKDIKEAIRDFNADEEKKGAQYQEAARKCFEYFKTLAESRAIYGLTRVEAANIMALRHMLDRAEGLPNLKVNETCLNLTKAAIKVRDSLGI